ncbi:unnamed protein product, partial [Amoebophrya sp. A25]
FEHVYTDSVPPGTLLPTCAELRPRAFVRTQAIPRDRSTGKRLISFEDTSREILDTGLVMNLNLPQNVGHDMTWYVPMVETLLSLLLMRGEQSKDNVALEVFYHYHWGSDVAFLWKKVCQLLHMHSESFGALDGGRRSVPEVTKLVEVLSGRAVEFQGQIQESHQRLIDEAASQSGSTSSLENHGEDQVLDPSRGVDPSKKSPGMQQVQQLHEFFDKELIPRLTALFRRTYYHSDVFRNLLKSASAAAPS